MKFNDAKTLEQFDSALISDIETCDDEIVEDLMRIRFEILNATKTPKTNKEKFDLVKQYREELIDICFFKGILIK